MPAMIFPPTPTDGDEVTQPNGKRYRYNAAKARWEIVPGAVGTGGDFIALLTGSVTTGNAISVVLNIVNYRSFIWDIETYANVTNATKALLRTGSDGATADAGAADYRWSQITGTGGNAASAGSDGDSGITVMDAAGSATFHHAKFYITNPAALENTNITGEVFGNAAGGDPTAYKLDFGGSRLDSLATNFLEFSLSSGNFSLARYTLYGLKGV